MQDKEILTKQFYEEYARIGKSLSSAARLEILDVLLQSEKTVETIAKETSLSIANVSKHLQNLLSARLVVNQKVKNFVYYQLANEEVIAFIQALHKIGEKQLSEVNVIKAKFLQSSNEVEVIDLQTLDEKMRKNEIILIDVRPSEEYDYAHITGAVSMPVAELQQYIESLPNDKEIVAYCRGPHCLMSTDAVAILEKYGKHAKRLTENVQDWKDYQQLKEAL